MRVVAISSSSIRLTWEPPRPEDQNGIIVAYNITITEAETGRVTYFQKEGTESLLIVNFLHPYYTYQCSISAETIGPGPPAFASVTTPQAGKDEMSIFVQYGLPTISLSLCLRKASIKYMVHDHLPNFHPNAQH